MEMKFIFEKNSAEPLMLMTDKEEIEIFRNI